MWELSLWHVSCYKNRSDGFAELVILESFLYRRRQQGLHMNTRVTSTYFQATCPTSNLWVCGFSPLSKPVPFRSEVTSPVWSRLSVWIYNEYHIRCKGKANLISCADVSVCCHSAEWSLPLHKHGAAQCGSVYPADTHSRCNEQTLHNTKTQRERER